MAKRKPPKRGSRWATEAAQQALLRFGPQEDALAELAAQAEGAYTTGVAQAHGTASNAISTVDAAVPGVTGIYDRAAGTQSDTAGLLAANVAGLGPGADALKAAIGLEGKTATDNLAAGRAQALTGLANQRVAARSGEQFAVSKAHDDLTQALTKIFAQKTSLAGQRGTFTALTENQLQDAAAKEATKIEIANAGNAQSERNSVRSSGIDPNTGLPIPGGKLDPRKEHGKVSATGAKLVPSGAHISARDAITQGIAQLGTLDPDKTDRHHAAPALIGGAPAEALKDPKTGKPQINKDGTPVKIPEIPAIGEWATIAADVYYDGHLSRANQRKLAERGYSIKQLGLPTYAQWKKAGGRRKSKMPSGASLFPPLKKP